MRDGLRVGPLDLGEEEEVELPLLRLVGGRGVVDGDGEVVGDALEVAEAVEPVGLSLYTLTR